MSWQPMNTAPMDGTEFLAWFQKHEIDDDGDSTDKVVGGAQAIISFTAGSWNEPQWLDASGAYYMDDWCFAEEPVLWHPLPPNPTIPAGVVAFEPCGKCKNRDRCEERGCVDRAATAPAPRGVSTCPVCPHGIHSHGVPPAEPQQGK